MRNILLLLFACMPLFLFGQGTKLLNAESVLMSSPENKLSSTEILNADTLDPRFISMQLIGSTMRTMNCG